MAPGKHGPSGSDFSLVPLYDSGGFSILSCLYQNEWLDCYKKIIISFDYRISPLVRRVSL